MAEIYEHRSRLNFAENDFPGLLCGKIGCDCQGKLRRFGTKGQFQRIAIGNHGQVENR